MLRFGFVMAPQSLESTREAAQAGEELGFSWLGVGNSPSLYRDCFLHLFEAAAVTTSIAVGPVVADLVTRHPVVVAGLLATLNERAGGRVVAAIGTGNGAPRGLELEPATLGELRSGVGTIRSHWNGDSREGAGCPIFIASDSPPATALAAELADGVVYGGTLEQELLEQHVAAVRDADRALELWVAPPVSLRAERDDAKSEIGALIAAVASRARSGLEERGIPAELHDDVRELCARYDYAYHADTTRPRNFALVSPRLADHLLDTACVWGHEVSWEQRLDALEDAGCDGVLFMLGNRDPAGSVRQIARRLGRLGRL